MRSETESGAPADFALPRDVPAGRGRRYSAVRSTLRRSFAVIVAAGAMFVGGFAWFAHSVSTLATPIDPKSADAIIVLTGGQFRLNAAMDLLKSGKGERLLISGVNPVATARDLRRASGADGRLFSCCVDVDHAALDTVGNAEESAKWVREHAYDSVILVTNNYHMPRTMLEMSRLLDGAELLPYPVVNTRLDGGEWLRRPEALRVLFTEYTKYLAALARTTIQPAHAPGETTLAKARPAAMLE